ncbi:hypothetical protein GCM10018952_41550 [Streptosporangium vulgare]|uniref:Transposase n=1 Tax=Streptosporangium vulgare TaxID=46190 RepID=A0ABV5TK50_9ACTN
MYPHGLSTGDLVPALERFLGPAAGLSSAMVSRLTSQWTDDHKAFQKRDLSATGFSWSHPTRRRAAASLADPLVTPLPARWTG